MAYTTNQAIAALDRYLGINASKKEIIDNTKNRGFLFPLETGEKVVIFVYPLVHKQDNTKNYFDTRDSGAYERAVAWNYSINHDLKYFCLGLNDSVDKYVDYVFSLECSEQVVEKISGTKNGVRSGPGNQIIIPNDFEPKAPFERISNKLGIYISAINQQKLKDYLETYDNRPYMITPELIDLEKLKNDAFEENIDNDEYQRAAEILKDYVMETGFQVPDIHLPLEALNEAFRKKFAPNALLSIPDSDLLRQLFYTKEQTNDSLCYWLEFNNDSRQYYGSIAGGSSYKFGLFQKKDDENWVSGSPSSPTVLTYEEALATGKSIRDALARGCEVISSHELRTVADYEKLDEDLQEAVGPKYWNLAWVHKYFSMIFPEKLSGYHSSDLQRHVLYSLQIKPSEKYYARSGQISMIEKCAGWCHAEFQPVFYDRFGDVRHFVRLGTSDSENNYADEWKAKGIAAIGWRNVGALSNYIIGDDISRKAIVEKLEQTYYPGDKRLASRKAGELSTFYKTDKNTVFVAVDGYRLLGLIDKLGEYRFNEESPMAHQKSGVWYNCFAAEEQLPNKNVGYMTSCYEISSETDSDNMLYLYRKYYYESIQADHGEEDTTEMTEFLPLVYHTDVDIGKDRNRIVFGAPGTGKSYLLKSDCEKLIEDHGGAFERVTFHPDYTYSQFVGSYKPVTDTNGKIRYDFVPGPFMRVYVDALKSGRTDDPHPHLLIIEEINRSKVAAVFGDIFQLLDRDADGVSEYAIQATEDVRKYLARKLGGSPKDYDEIKLPNNMYIWATMNSADQGVYPMDTAFKRRWNFEYIGINDNEKEIKGVITLGEGDHSQTVDWNVLRKAINEKLSHKYKLNEDKLMGPFFISKQALECGEDNKIKYPDKFKSVFKSKVIMYLYEDAARQQKHDLFSGCEDTTRYSAVCKSFDAKGALIFGDDFMDNYYAPLETE